MKTSIIIAEDHKLMRTGYISVLNEREDFEVIGEANNGKELLEILEKKVPDVLLLDLEMPVMNGSQAYDQIQKDYPGIKTVIISSYYDENFVSEYFMRGVNGYLSKGCDAEQLYAAVDTVMRNEFYFNTDISKLLLDKIVHDKQKESLIKKIDLTETEMQILKLICEERTYKEIADLLGYSIHTIEYHKQNILKKTNQSTVIGLVKFAIRNGITNTGR